MATISPHGYRISVRELVEDARNLGTWRALGDHEPRPGDLAVSARDGEDPTKGGKGHVERVESFHQTHVITIGGNEKDTWIRAPLQMNDPNLRGWILYPDGLRLAALVVAREELEKKPTEIPGKPSNPIISAYLEPCRRGGTAVAGMPAEDGSIDTSGVLVGMKGDENAWCAAAASACCFAALKA